MAMYSITALFLALAFVSTITLAVEENGLDENEFLFTEDMEFSFDTGHKQECIVSLIENKEDAETEKCFQRIRVDQEDADTETWENILQNCGEREVFFLQPKDCNRIGYQRSLTCHYLKISIKVCTRRQRYCCRRWIGCTRWCEKCLSYSTLTATRLICG